MDESFLGFGAGYPFAFANGQLQSASDEELVKQSIMQILATSKGERVMLPDYGCGINDMVFETNNQAIAHQFEYLIKDALGKYEPRIEIVSISVTPDSQQRNCLNIAIEYLIKSINSSQNLVYPFYLQGAAL